MMFAKVIVDVPAKQTNRPFDYAIPERLQDWVEVGSRVGVPFGSRVLQGFVVGIADYTEMASSKVKPIEQVLDMNPPLTKELIELAGWMGRKYVCPEIVALQAMLPGALKAKYERYVALSDDLIDMDGDAEVVQFVRSKGAVLLETLLERYPDLNSPIKAMIKQGILVETQTIKDRLKAKKVLTVFPPEPSVDVNDVIRSLPAGARRQQEILRFLADRPEPIRLSELMVKLNVGAGTVKSLADKGYVGLREVEMFRDPYAQKKFVPTSPLPLTEEQQQVFQPILSCLESRQPHTFLLHGVTGSGKTEVYLQSIQACLDYGREAIVLVPEISLTPQMVERFKSRFGDLVAVLHSRLSHGERYDEWRKIQLGKVKVAIGARSAIFAPFTKIGLIIIDEEHESSYKQEESPKYHTRDVAVFRASCHGAAVVLGSATPSLESFHRAMTHLAERERGSAEEVAATASLPVPASDRSDRIAPAAAEQPIERPVPPVQLLTMQSRVEGRPLPQVHVIDMRDELRGGNRSMFSRTLHKALAERLERQEQIVLLLNRRGYSTFVMCRSCGYVADCPHCDISLTYHQHSRAIRCHYCGYATRELELCPDCGSEHIRHFGTGTQRVEEELGKLFPGIRVIRMDVDTTSEKGSHEKWLTMFRDRQADVLLGTQMVAKGLDFPFVTLVGVISADTVLNLPDFRASEKTFQLLTQVAGRAGRHQLPGEVVIQTYTPEHYSIQTASRHDYGQFAQEELQLREERGYPPYCDLLLITMQHEQAQLLVRFGESLAAKIKEAIRTYLPSIQAAAAEKSGRASDFPFAEVFGPVASPIPRIKDRYRFQCMIKYRGDDTMIRIVRQVIAGFEDTISKQKLQVSVDVDPQVMM